MIRKPAISLAAAVLLVALGCDRPEEVHPVEPGTRGGFPAEAGGPSWPQWGGPRGDFTVDDEGLAASWGPDGPACWYMDSANLWDA